MPDFDDDEYESFDLEDSGDDSDAEADAVDDGPEDDDLDDAAPDEIDFVVAAYREDGQPMVQALAADLANDLEELIIQLRRLPGDAGAIGFVSLVEEVFVIARVRGQHVQLLLSDGAAATEWPIARDVADMLGEEIPDPDEEEAEPMGDLGILSDLGVSDFDMSTLIDNLDLSSDQMLIEIADKIKIGPQFRKVAESAFP
ncbi:MAG TPA: tRNA adenosine deaminase-associated protein [Propionibacteriaceae bacterium]|nr:tRNA adenosine deaminase-associated protein [Propionibacteriaceae bacterium]